MTKFCKLGCLLNLLFFATLSSAQDFTDGELIGKTFWVKPAKEIYRRLEFFRQPSLSAGTFFPMSKKQIRILTVNRGWIRVNFTTAFNGYEDAYAPIGYLKRNLYSSSTFNRYAFDRATFFTEDPDAIEERENATAIAPVGKKDKGRGPASKFFRHKHKCCGITQPNYANKPTPAPR